jgi:predicted peptidase
MMWRAMIVAVACVMTVNAQDKKNAAPLPGAGVEDDVVKRFQEKSLVYTGGEYKDHTFKYRLLQPIKIEQGRKYPLVIFLHGAGERGSDNVAQLKFLPAWMSEQPMREQYPCFLVAPQCPTDHRWGSIDWRSGKMEYPAEPGDEMKYLEQLVQKTMKELPVDENRVYLTGLSMGGMGTWELAARHPEWFACAAPICGIGNPRKEWAQKLVNLPIWVWHGDADTAVKVDHSRAMVQAIKDLGGTKIQYTELPGVGHNSWTPAYQRPDGVVPWMFKQRKGS